MAYGSDRSANFVISAKDAASAVMKNVGKEMGALGKTGGAVFKTLAVAAAAVATAIATAGAAALKFTQGAIKAAIADDAEQQKLIATLQARGLSAEQATKRTNELIEAGQKLAFTDSETRKAFEIASAFSKKYSNQQKILATAQDLARAKNISLDAATKLVGRAFDGSTGSLSRYGIALEKGAKGAEALNQINGKVGGVAKQYSKTLAGQFDIVRDSINETVESIGMAIGGGEGLPTFVRLLEGIRPVIDDVLGGIKDNLPSIQRFSRELVEKFLAKLPGYVATAKRELPILIDKAKAFIGSVAGFGKDIASFLGPDGLVSVGIFGLGAKMGGLGGGLGALFASEFIKKGVDPLTASITGTIAGALTAGIVQGLASQAATAAVSKFLSLFKSIPVAPSLSVPVPGGGAPGGVPASTSLKDFGITTALSAALSIGLTEIVPRFTKAFQDALGINTKPSANPADRGGGTFGAPAGVGLADYYIDKIFGGGKLYGNMKDAVVDGMAPIAANLGRDINFTNETKLTLDGKVVAQSVSRYLAPAYNAGTGTRTGGR